MTEGVKATYLDDGASRARVAMEPSVTDAATRANSPELRRERVRLYDLLPRYIRYRDAHQGKPLERVMDALQIPFDALQRDMEDLYSGWFVESCDLWQVPYIGALLGVRGIGEAGPVLPSQRRLVANALAYRRAKGTPAALERAASDATGWPCHLVDYRQTTAQSPPLVGRVGRTPDDGTVDLASPRELEDLGTPWNVVSHGADVRSAEAEPPPLEEAGGYRPGEVGLVFYRLDAMPLVGAQARAVGEDPEGDGGERDEVRGADEAGADGGWRRFHFHPMGVDVPLFNPERGNPSPLHLSRREDLPAPLDPALLRRELEAAREAPGGGRERMEAGGYWSADDPPFRIRRQDRPVRPEEMAVCDLSSWVPPVGRRDDTRSKGSDADNDTDSDTAADRDATRRDSIRAWIDPQRGRFLLAPAERDDGRKVAEDGRVWVDFHYGTPVDLGGGTYPRRPVPPPGDALGRWVAVVCRDPVMEALEERSEIVLPGLAPGERLHRFASLDDALAAWNRQRVPPIPPSRSRPRSPRDGVIVIADSAVHPVRRPLDLQGRRLLIQAVAGRVPTLVGDLRLRAPDRHVATLWETSSRAPSLENQLVLDGVWVDGGVEIEGDASLTVCQSTILPRPGDDGSRPPAVTAVEDRRNLDPDRWTERTPDLFRLRFHDSVVGGISLGRRKVGLGVVDSIVDGDVDLPGAEASFARSTVLGRVEAGRVPKAVDSLFAGPLRVELQDGRMLACWVPEGSRTPPRERCAGGPANLAGELFRSTRYGDPAFCMLDSRAPRELRQGATNGNEIGVMNRTLQGDRLSHLARVLDEFLPVGMNARVWFAT